MNNWKQQRLRQRTVVSTIHLGALLHQQYKIQTYTVEMILLYFCKCDWQWTEHWTSTIRAPFYFIWKQKIDRHILKRNLFFQNLAIILEMFLHPAPLKKEEGKRSSLLRMTFFSTKMHFILCQKMSRWTLNVQINGPILIISNAFILGLFAILTEIIFCSNDWKLFIFRFFLVSFSCNFG